MILVVTTNKSDPTTPAEVVEYRDLEEFEATLRRRWEYQERQATDPEVYLEGAVQLRHLVYEAKLVKEIDETVQQYE